MSDHFDWSRFIVRIDVKASREALYEAWTSQEMLELWFLRLAEFTSPQGNVRGRFEKIEQGDTYKWLWHGYDDNSVEYGEVLVADGSIFRFTFGKAGICTVSVREVAGENVIELLQEQIPVDEKGKQYYHIGCQAGWTFYFANLKSILEGGIDLRNRNEQLRNMINS